MPTEVGIERDVFRHVDMGRKRDFCRAVGLGENFELRNERPADPLALEGRVNGYVRQMGAFVLQPDYRATGNVTFELRDKNELFRNVLFQSG